MANQSSRTRNAKLNWLSSIGLQTVTAISGLILPRIIIPAFGSTINGTIASITQFISYMTLLEAGVGGVFRAALYKPLYENDERKISGIINAQKQYYRKIGLVFILYIIALCFFYPLIVRTELDKGSLVVLIIALSAGTFLEYFVSLPYKSLIVADQMIRLANILSSLIIIFNVAATVILMKAGASIVVIKITAAVIAVLNPVVYVTYVRRNYKLDKNEKPDLSALAQRKNGMIHHFAYFIHRNTDILLLSVFVGTATVSIYSVYLAVVAGIERLVTSISGSLNASIGNVLTSGDRKAIDKTVDSFELIQTMITTILFSVAAMMLMPFIRIYTANMKDANYIQPVFGYFLIAAEVVFCIRSIYSAITLNGNRFKETQTGAILESVTNLTVSLCLIILLPTEGSKLIGIAAGTLAGMTVRLVFELRYLKKGLIFRPVSRALRTIGVCASASILSIGVCSLLIDYTCSTIAGWIISAALTTLVTGCATLGMCFLFINETTRNVLRKLTSRK